MNWPLIANDLQTNEVWRAARLITAAHSLKAYNESDFIASKLGASASLNLVFNRFHLPLGNDYGPQNSPEQLAPKWQGTLPLPAPIVCSMLRAVISPL